MKVRILAFGIAREILGNSSISFPMHEGARVKELIFSLKEKYPRLKQLSTFKIALNNHFAEAHETISADDEIAVIPPVSGG